MATDDDTGWTEILVDAWGPLVRDAVVDRVERATVGHRGPLVRTVAAPDDARYAWKEELHQLVLAGIQAEVGADLEELGSQAAWACYDDVWVELGRRWADGGSLARLAGDEAERAARMIAQLPGRVAAHAGADVGSVHPEALRIGDVVLVDREGLFAYLATADPGRRERAIVDALLDLTGGA